MSKYPEHDRMAEVRERSQVIGEFLDFIPYRLCEINNESWSFPQWVPVGRSVNAILADYFGIDLNRVEQEKRAMLADLRAAAHPVRVPRRRVVRYPTSWNVNSPTRMSR